MLYAKKAILGLTAILLTSFSQAGDFFIDEYEFEWKVLTEGNLVMNVVKTEETAYIQLRNGDPSWPSYLRLTPDESTKIGSALAKTRDYFNEQKRAGSDESERIQVEDYEVTFHTSAKFGFSVIIRDSASFGVDTFSLSRAQAIKLQPLLMQAPDMVDFINELLSFD